MRNVGELQNAKQIQTKMLWRTKRSVPFFLQGHGTLEELEEYRIYYGGKMIEKVRRLAERER